MKATFSTRSTGCRSYIGTLASPVADPQLVTAMCGAFNAVLLQEAHDHIPHISDQFNTYSDEGGLAILLNKDTFLPDAIKYPIIEESTSRTVGPYSFGRLWAPMQTTGWSPQNGHVLLSPPTQRGRQKTRRRHFAPSASTRT